MEEEEKQTSRPKPIKEQIRSLVDELECENKRPNWEIYKEIDELLQKLEIQKASVAVSEEITEDEDVSNLQKIANICYEWLGDYPKATKYYEKLADDYPNHSKILKGLGDCLRKLGKHQEAIEKYNVAIKKYEEAKKEGLNDPKLEAAILNNKALSLIELYFDKPQELDSAREALEKAVQLDPAARVIYLCNTGRVLDLQGKEKESQEIDKKVSQLAKDNNIGKDIEEGDLKYFYTILPQLIQYKDLINKVKGVLETAGKKYPGDLQFEEVKEETTKVLRQKTQEINDLYEEFQEESRERMIASSSVQNLNIVQPQMVEEMQRQIALLQSILLKVTKELEILQQNSSDQSQEIVELKQNQQESARLLVELDRKLSFKLDYWEKIIEDRFKDVKDEEILKKIKDYYFGFTETLKRISIAAQAVCSGDFQLDNPSSVLSFVSFVVSCLPMIPAVAINSTTTALHLIGTRPVKRNAIRLTELGSGAELEQKIGDAAFKIIMDSNYQKIILKVTKEDLEEFSKNFLQKFKNCCKRSLKKLEEAIYGVLYEAPAAKLGHRDANLLVVKWLNKEIQSRDQITEAFFKNTISQKDLSGLVPEPNSEAENEKTS